MNINKFGIYAVFSAIALIALFRNPSVIGAADTPSLIDSRNLQNTVFTPLLQSEIEPGKNLVYCASFQAAWNEFIDTVIHEPVLVEGDSLPVRMLNKKFGGNNVIPEELFIAAAGFEEAGIIERIRVMFKDKFRLEAPPGNLNPGAPGDILVYAYLRREFSFKIEFENLPGLVLFNNDSPVRAFGIQRFTFDEPHQGLAAQVEIFDFKNDNDFIIRLKSLSLEDELILAKIKPLPTLLETVNQAFLRISANPYPTGLFEGETVRIPKFDFDISSYFTEFMGRSLLNREFYGRPLNRMIQVVRFKLNEKGALFSAETVRGEDQPLTLETVPRKLIFNSPFLVLIKKKKCQQPYFAMWIENTELMLK